jgi:hypothetical protein
LCYPWRSFLQQGERFVHSMCLKEALSQRR